MKTAVVSIGLNKTGGLPLLRAAVSGAEDFAGWAKTLGHDVTLVTDTNGDVRLENIKDVVKAIVDKAIYEKLIVYFSGHGILKTQRAELWLLSGAPEDPDQAIDLTACQRRSRDIGIPHVIFVSDACRSRPTNELHSQMDGGTIFPNRPADNLGVEVDTFFATLPGNPAYEIPVVDAMKRHEAVFTRCLMSVLTGGQESIIESFGSPPRRIVRSRSLKKFLVQAVPKAAGRVDIKLEQNADGWVESDLPNYFGEIPEGVVPVKVPRTRSRRGKGENRDQIVTIAPDRSGTDLDHLRGMGSNELMADFKPAIDRLLGNASRDSFETETGFTVFGSGVARARAVPNGQRPPEIFEEGGLFHIRVFPEADRLPISVVIEFQDGRSTVLAGVPGFIGAVSCEDGVVVHVSYKRSSHGPLEPELEERQAFAAVAARNGILKLSEKNADFMRVQKASDPTLGIYAAYAYAESGEFDQVRSVYDFMKSDGFLPFDLAGILGDSATRGESLMVPFCPMIQQGWSYLKPLPDHLPGVLANLRRHLVPGLWTTFSNKGTAILFDAIESGKLK